MTKTRKLGRKHFIVRHADTGIPLDFQDYNTLHGAMQFYSRKVQEALEWCHDIKVAESLYEVYDVKREVIVL